MSPNTRREPQLVLPEQCEEAPTNDDSPCTSQCYGIPLGTPAAKEAAKSFWNMEMLQQSLEKIVHYSIQEGDSLSLDSIGSSIDSADVQTPPIPLSPSLPLHLSAPSSPFVSPKEERGTRPQLSPCSSPLIASSHATRKVHSATTYRLKPLLRPTFSIEGKQLKLSSRRSPKLPLRKSVSCQSFSVTKSTSDGTLTPDDGFHEWLLEHFLFFFRCYHILERFTMATLIVVNRHACVLLYNFCYFYHHDTSYVSINSLISSAHDVQNAWGNGNHFPNNCIHLAKSFDVIDLHHNYYLAGNHWALRGLVVVWWSSSHKSDQGQFTAEASTVTGPLAIFTGFHGSVAELEAVYIGVYTFNERPGYIQG